MNLRIAIVAKTASRQTCLASFYGNGECETVRFRNTTDLITHLHRDTLDLVYIDTLDTGEPNSDLVARIRSGNIAPRLAIILCAPDYRPTDIQAGLDAGADAFFWEPIDPMVARASTAALMRRIAPRQQDGVQSFGQVTFDPARQTASRGGEVIGLTSKEFAVALLLFRNLGRPLSRTYIMAKVWGQTWQNQSRTLDTHLYRLKNRSRLLSGHGFELTTLNSYGYRLDQMDETRLPRDCLRLAQ